MGVSLSVAVKIRFGSHQLWQPSALAAISYQHKCVDTVQHCAQNACKPSVADAGRSGRGGCHSLRIMVRSHFGVYT
jgi:hypothetical protein